MKNAKRLLIFLLAAISLVACHEKPHATTYAARYQTAADVITTSNQGTLSGLAQTIDGVALSTAGRRVWLVGQSTITQEGCYLTASGTWPRCDDVPVGYDAAGDRFTVRFGTANSGSWTITNPPGSGLVGVNDLTASAGGGGGSSFPANGDLVTLVAGATAAALPSYTTSGGPGAGFTLTASANGAFPTLDATAVVNANDLFYLKNGASTTDNGVYQLTNAGSGGSAWVAVRYTGLDEVTEIVGSKFRVKAGYLHGGGEYQYTAVATPVFGTTHLFWHRTDVRITPTEGVRVRSDFNAVLSLAAGVNATVPGTEILAITGGTAAAMTPNVTNTSSVRGVYSFSSGTTTATGFGGFQGGFTAAVTAPDGGDSIIISQDMGWDWTWTVTAPVLSNGTDEFAINTGWAHTRNNSQKISSDFAGFIYDRTSAVSSTNWLIATAAGSVSTGTVLDSGVTVTAGNYNKLRSLKDPGDNTIRFFIDGVSVGTLSSNVPSATLSMINFAFKSVGTTNINFLRAGSFAMDLDFPLGLTA